MCDYLMVFKTVVFPLEAEDMNQQIVFIGLYRASLYFSFALLEQDDLNYY